MKRLTQQNNNTPQHFDENFEVRSKKPVDEFDLRRWEIMVKFFKRGKLIDLGCLDSAIPFLIREKFPEAEVWGLDFSPKVIDFYQKLYPSINYVLGNVYETKFPHNYFDYVCAGELIEHLEDPQSFLKESFRILRKGGTFVLSTPLEEEKEVGAVDKEHHIWSFSKDDINEMLKPYGNVHIKVVGSKWFPKYKYSFKNIIAFVRKI